MEDGGAYPSFCGFQNDHVSGRRKDEAQ